ncbi:hypothetical protein ACHAXS_009405 [Conticribra weissflogii]
MPQDKGLILNPTMDLNVDAYLDANIARLCRDKDGADLTMFRQSKLQTETPLLTMKTEVVVFVACCRGYFQFWILWIILEMLLD